MVCRTKTRHVSRKVLTATCGSEQRAARFGRPAMPTTTLVPNTGCPGIPCGTLLRATAWCTSRPRADWASSATNPTRWQKKAAYFERELEDWNFKRLGFVHKLYWSPDEDGWLREISDNDGGHAAHYLAAATFKYAATGEESPAGGSR